jgi:CrcB protein
VGGPSGFLGSAARYAVSGPVYGLFPGAAFPVGTLAVNVLGCLCIGGLTGLAEGRGLLGPEARVSRRVG